MRNIFVFLSVDRNMRGLLIDHDSTVKEILNGSSDVYTTDLSSLSFERYNNRFTGIFVARRIEGRLRLLELVPGMELKNGKILKIEHNLSRMVLSGELDEDIEDSGEHK